MRKSTAQSITVSIDAVEAGFNLRIRELPALLDTLEKFMKTQQDEITELKIELQVSTTVEDVIIQRTDGLAIGCVKLDRRVDQVFQRVRVHCQEIEKSMRDDTREKNEANIDIFRIIANDLDEI